MHTATVSIATAAKPQTSFREVIAANVQNLFTQLRAGHSEALTAYLSAMGHFHKYSFGNILEIARQRPDSTRVAGVYTWNRLGRRVKKGERGIRILAPLVRKPASRDEEPQDERKLTAQPPRMGFRPVYVFDIAQTEGSPLPELTERVSGDVGGNRERLIDFFAAQGIELEFNAGIAPAIGMSYGGRIAILPGQAPAEEFSTLVHELAHEMCHKAARRSTTTKSIRETEAEAVAYVVSQAIGLDGGRAAADYIQLYRGTPELLMDSLEVIQRASAAILAALKPRAAHAEAA